MKILLLIIAIMVLVTVISIVIVTSISNKKESSKIIKKILLISGICILAVGLIGGSFVLANSKDNNTKVEEVTLETAGFKEVTLNQYISLLNGSEKSIILVARPTCHYCVQFTPILKQAKDDLKLTINYVNTDNFSSDDWNTFNNSNDYLKTEDWGTPLILIVQNGSVVDSNNGYVELDTIKAFFTKNGLGD